MATSPTLTTHRPEIDSALQSAPTRIASIDILRAITMVLMIFVNDLWSLQNVPVWLEHVPYEADGMGLSDVIFPAFLFIVGMSIPLAIANRRAKGDTTLQLVKHIGTRSLALLIMGVFLVNGENINAAATGMPRIIWYSLSCIAFILIWNAYPKTTNLRLAQLLQVLGVGMLLTLAFIYRGGSGETLNRFSTYWWGILGLIGWSYLVSALITVFTGNRTSLIFIAWAFFCGLSMLSSAGIRPENDLIRMIPNPITGGTLPAFTLGGILTSHVFEYFRKQNAHGRLMTVLSILAVALILLGLFTRTFWPISKLKATTPWLFICSAFTILAFVAVYWLADLRGKAHWFRFIRPAGTDTLLCYLMPYFAYAGVVLLGIHWPALMLTGAVGLLKSFVFALLCVWVAGILSRRGIRLKL
jgi:heparan-alpha-glucosaminide N-acetyltransferase